MTVSVPQPSRGMVVMARPALDAYRYRPHGPLWPAHEADLRLLNAPTRGDLAGDGTYLQAVLRSWTDAKGPGRYRADPSGFDEVRGEARVLWAGRTPNGPAAAVGQLIRHQHRNKQEFRRDVVELGFIVGGPDGRPTLVDDDHGDAYDPTRPRKYGFLVGADRSVLVVLDIGVPVGYILGTINARVAHDMTPLEFRDGAAVVSLPPQPSYPKVTVARLPFDAANDRILLGNTGGS